MQNNNRIRSYLLFFLGSIAILIGIGFIFIYSASSVYATERGLPATYFVQKQAIGLALGLIGLIIVGFLPSHRIASFIPSFFILSLILTLLTKFSAFGIAINGAYRWLKVPGFIFQPSELLKLAVILYMARLIERKHDQLNSFIAAYLPFLIIICLSCIALLSQPDFGMALTVASTAFIMLIVAQVPMIYLLISFGCSIPIIGALIYLKAYRLRRILIFLNPWRDPQGAGFQIIQSLIAIGNGGWLGTGISYSQQKLFYLPMQHTDFIFSIIAEETGFFGASFVIILYIIVLYNGIKLAINMKSPFAAYAILGYTLIITIQSAMNIFVTLGLAPTKGVGLPFISYGSSSLVCSVAFIGIILSCIDNNK
jgi:cell division protein FtsW